MCVVSAVNDISMHVIQILYIVCESWIYCSYTANKAVVKCWFDRCIPGVSGTVGESYEDVANVSE